MWLLGLCRNIFAQSCVILWSPGQCRNIPGLSCAHPGLCRNMPTEPEPFDLCACSCMSYLVVFKAGFVQELESFTVCVRESWLWHLQNPVRQGYPKKIL